MVRVLNFLCVALMALAILADYHISEQTRVARVELNRVVQRTAEERSKMSVLQAEWVQLASPARIQQLAETTLNMSDTATVQLSSLTLLPRRGEAPLGGAQARDASAPAPEPSEIVKIAAHSGM